MLGCCHAGSGMDSAWAEIGFILLESGRPGEAVDHLRAVSHERRPLDTRYYSALGAALRETGRFGESLNAFEASLELNPDDPVIVAAAAVTAALAGDKSELDFTQNPGKVMDDITFVRSHWWLVSEGFSLSTANSDVQKLPATLYHRIADSLAYAA